MSKINTTFLATVKSYNGSADNPAQPDKNGHMPVLLHPVAGQCPDKRIIAGTVAMNEGMQVNRSYLVTCTETEPDEEHGRQFNYTVVSEANLVEILQATQFLGAPSLIPVLSREVEEQPEEEEEIIEEA